ncbi:MAG: hypothetical protein R2751_19710 [Bacteroidales bacterium]
MNTATRNAAGLLAEKPLAWLWVLFGFYFLSNMAGGALSTLMAVYLPLVAGELSQESQVSLEQIGAGISAVYLLGWTLGGSPGGSSATGPGDFCPMPWPWVSWASSRYPSPSRIPGSPWSSSVSFPASAWAGFWW